MAVYVECPGCHRKQSLKNQTCRACNFDLKKARRQNQAPFWVYLRHQKKQYWRRIGESFTIAREQEAIIRSKLVRDEFQHSKHTRTTIGAYFAKTYLPMVQTKNRAWDKDEARFRLHLGPVFGDMRFKDLTPQDVEGYKTRRVQAGAKNATVNRELSLLKTIFNTAIKTELFNGRNPVSVTGMLPENNSHVARALTHEQAERLLEELPSSTRPLFEFALATGLRIGNVKQLKWENVDFTSRTITVPKTKSGKPLIIPLSDWAAHILRQVLRHLRSPFVFCHPDGAPYFDPRQGFKNAQRRAGIEPPIRGVAKK